MPGEGPPGEGDPGEGAPCRRDAPVPTSRLPPVVAQGFAGAQQRLGGARRGGGAVQRVGEEAPQRGGCAGAGRGGGGRGAAAATGTARDFPRQLPPRPRPEVEVEIGRQQRSEQQQHNRAVPARPRHGRCGEPAAAGTGTAPGAGSSRRRRRLPGAERTGELEWRSRGVAGTSGRRPGRAGERSGSGRGGGIGDGERGEGSAGGPGRARGADTGCPRDPAERPRALPPVPSQRPEPPGLPPAVRTPRIPQRGFAPAPQSGESTRPKPVAGAGSWRVALPQVTRGGV